MERGSKLFVLWTKEEGSNIMRLECLNTPRKAYEKHNFVYRSGSNVVKLKE